MSKGKGEAMRAKPNPDTESRREQVVVCAACRLGTTIVLGVRHFDMFMCAQLQHLEGDWTNDNTEQGFINQYGEFLTRQDALLIVQTNKQVFNSKRNGSKTKLFSEGLY